MKKLLLFLFLPISLLSQKYDNVWLFGYNSSAIIDGIEGVEINFESSPINIEYDPITLFLKSGSSCISSSNGDLLFYTNGCSIANRNHEIILNGNDLNPGEVHDIQCSTGYTSGIQSNFFLPMPDNDSIFYLFHKGLEYYYEPQFNVITSVLYNSIINLSPSNNNYGEVIEKNIPIIVDSLGAGQLTAVKHANGKDWFIVSPKYLSNKYHILTLTEQGTQPFFEQEIGNSTVLGGEGGGQAVFSPNGKKYIRYTPSDGIFIFDFDRTEGMLSNFQHIPINDGAFAGGAVVSPSSRFLYIPSEHNLYQFDLQAEDITASKILIDTFDGYTSPFPTTFFNGQLAPDCKIYINTFATVDVLHVIHNPDELGIACNFEQHAIQLPFNHLRSLPHFPNYRLGPLVEGEEPLPPCELVGDVQEITPKAQEPSLHIYPNPAYDVIQLEAPSALEKEITYQIIDSYGRALEQGSFLQSKELNISPYPPGIYYCQIKKGQNIIDSKRFVIIR